MSILILFLMFFILMLLNLPIAASLGTSILVTIILFEITTVEFFISNMITSANSFALLAIPFFILAGELMGAGGVSERLIRFANSIVGHMTGGFALVTILTCMFFASISGSGPATVAAIGYIMVPAMTKRGYDIKFATATVAAAGSLGAIIPPSIDMILFSMSTGTSVGDMFIGGIFPGILVGLSLMVWAYIYSKKKGYKGTDIKPTVKNILKELNAAKWALVIPVIILGGIYSGIFTPTESAAVAIIVGLIAGVYIYKELKLSDLPGVLIKAATTTASIFFIVSVAYTLGKVLAIDRIPSKITVLLTNIHDNPIIIILLMNILLLMIGTFMESSAAIIILAPMLLPIAVELGFEPVHFGLMMIVNLTMGFITPPVGINLFVASGISGLSIEKISKALIPYFISMLFSLTIIIVWPNLTLILVDLINK